MRLDLNTQTVTLNYNEFNSLSKDSKGKLLKVRASVMDQIDEMLSNVRDGKESREYTIASKSSGRTVYINSTGVTIEYTESIGEFMGDLTNQVRDIINANYCETIVSDALTY